MTHARRLRTSIPLLRSVVRSVGSVFGLTLIVASLVLSPVVTAVGEEPHQVARWQGPLNRNQERRVTHVPRPREKPDFNLPNINELRRHRPPQPAAAAPIPSTMRSPRKPLQMRRGAQAPIGLGIPRVIGATESQRAGTARAKANQKSLRSHHARAHAPVAAVMTPQEGADALALARLDPFNQSGHQLRARDVEWSLPLLSLPGRAGTNLGLTLSYSSLVWTRSGSSMYFDADDDSPSPGFRLGFPIVQQRFFDAQAGRNAFLMVTAAGQRLALRQVGATNLYEASDSSYVQLFDYGWLLLRTTDGTVMGYSQFGDQWRCTGILDRNGNHLTIAYNEQAEIREITDTLGRVIKFTYDANNHLQSISQSWNGAERNWATFGWRNVTIQPGFTLPLVGATSGETIPVLGWVGLADGDTYSFYYNDAAQVNTVTRTHGAMLLARTTYGYGPATDDCPRLETERVWAQNWNGDIDGVPAAAEEALTQFSDAGNGTHTLKTPDQTEYKEFYGGAEGFPGSGGGAPLWGRGLVTRTEVWVGTAEPKATVISWTQDNPGASYQTNPRVIQTDIYDSAGNHRRTTIDYGAYAQYGLPQIVTEYGNGPDEIRHTYTQYNLSQAYLERHIIGLPSLVIVADTTHYYAWTTYGYDESAIDSQATNATMHTTAHNSGFVVGRGNLTSVWRWDVSDLGNSDKALKTRMTYDAAGSLLTTTDPAGHTSSLGYMDNFGPDGHSRNTFAYPSSLTDADGHATIIQYNYDFGARTIVIGPPPGNPGQYSSGVIQTFSYDDAARLQRATILNTGAYMDYTHGPNYLVTLTSVNAPGDSPSFTLFDGGRRPIATVSSHPGSQFGYRAQLTHYDIMGRVSAVSNPTEIDGSNWHAAGEDDPNNPNVQGHGFVYTQQTYDWQGRPLLTINQDQTYKEASYSGCGCAGGEVVTLTDEVGRQQKVYSDVLGRQWKSEVLNDNGNVYSATATYYNARDQITAVNSYKGAATSDLSCPSGTCMQSVTTFDGYGRIATQKLPQQSSPTTYAYKPDDLVETVTDPRGVIATNSYNNRHLLTGVSYTPAGGVPALASVSFGYDAAGNRISMSDGTGTATYNYDQLSRMTSETRTFTGLSNSYTMVYGYNLSGLLTSITEPSGAQVSYNYDSSGRLSGMPASGYDGVTSFLSNPSYRATGAIKHATYGNGVQLNVTYNSRMQIGQYQVSSVNFNVGATMSYYNDGRTNTAFDLSDGRFDRKYEFDFSARLKEAYSGVEAHGAPPPPLNQANSPYRQTYTYDEWNNATSRTGRIWAVQTESDTASYGSDNKNGNFNYDAAGNATFTGYQDGWRTYDAAGRPVTFTSGQNWQVYPNWPSGHPDAPALETEDTFDGTGQVAKHINHVRHDDSYTDLSGEMITHVMSDTVTTTYYVRSSVLGGKTIAELDQNGVKTKGYVYAGGARVATQTVNGSSNWVQLEATNPVTGAAITTDANGTYAARKEPDPLGRELATAPDPTIAIDPLASSKWNDPMPIEYTGGPTEDYLKAQADWAHDMTLRSLRTALVNGHKATATLILEKNPNIGIRTNDGRSLYGQDAGTYLHNQRFDELLQFEVSLEAVGGSALPASQPQKGHLGPRSKRGTPYVDRDVLNSCTKDYFGVTLDSFDESRRDHSGSFTGTGRSVLPSIPNGPNGTATFTINNIVHNSNAWLTRKNNSLTLPGEPTSGPITGLTIRDRPLRNYTGYDNSPMQILMTQVHELGHSLDSITGRGYDISENHNGKTDLAGWKLENCVRKRNGFKLR